MKKLVPQIGSRFLSIEWLIVHLLNVCEKVGIRDSTKYAVFNEA